MYDDERDDYGFWADEPTRPLERITARRRPAGPPPVQPTRRPRPVQPQVGTRRHTDTQQLPVVAGAVDGVRKATVQIDPLLRRVGALAVAIALLVPVAISLRGGSDDDRAALQPEQTDQSIDSSTPAALVAAAETTIDIDALPEAVPVNRAAASPTSSPDAGASTAPTATGASADTTQVAAPQPRIEAVAPTAAACKKYTVVAGDYWILIAKKVSVSLNELLAASGSTTATALFPGRTICVPANASAPTTAAPPTTAKPTTTTVKPTTTTAAPFVAKQSYTRAEVEAIIRQVWPDNLENEAVRIATRESNLTPTAKNFCCHGLFQIYYSVHKSWLNAMGVTNVAQLYNPLTNAYVAYALYLRAGGWGPWKL